MYQTVSVVCKALKAKEQLEKQINGLISNFEKEWFGTTLIPITGIKNNLPYNQQKVGEFNFS